MDDLQRFLLNTAGSTSKIISKIHAPWTRKLITESDEIEMLQILVAGDIVITRTNGELSNPFVPGFWGHVGVFTERGTVIQATTHGVVETKLSWFLQGKDYVAAVRPHFLSEAHKAMMIEYCRNQVGKPYDFSFNTSNISKFYCSELIYMGIKSITGESPFKLKKILSRETVAPEDFYNATKLFTRVYKSKSYLET